MDKETTVWMATSHKSENYGKGTATLKSEQLPPDAQALRRLLVARFGSPDYQPPVLPSVAFELLRIVRRPDVGVREVVELLERDGMLASQVLRLAQSASMSRGTPVRSLTEAVGRVGLQRATGIFFRAALEAKVFRAKGYEAVMERLRVHSIATATAARLICRQTSLFDEYAYLCGLLHDVGIAACMIALADQPRGVQTTSFDWAWPVIRDLHGEVLERMLKLWDLPDELRLVLTHHVRRGVTGRGHPLAAVTQVGEVMAARLGKGFADEAPEARYDLAANELSLDAGSLARLEKSVGEALVKLD
jgi:HD-like signal output (HDOD) protein